MSALLDTVPPATAGGSRRRLRGCAYWRHRSAGHVLRHHLDPGEGGVEVALQGDVEILILGAGAVTGEVQGLFDQGFRSTLCQSPLPPRECSSQIVRGPVRPVVLTRRDLALMA